MLPLLRDKAARVEFAVRLDQHFNVIPRRMVVIMDWKIALGEGITLQQLARIRQESAVDERQADMVGFQQRLADARAHRAASSAIKIHDAVPADLNSDSWRDDRHDVVNFEYNVQPIL